jgi:hypothetical protein
MLGGAISQHRFHGTKKLSRKISREWPVRVDSEEYALLVREWFGNLCPYCRCDLATSDSVVEHLDGMNRFRAGLHVPGNVLVACKRCNSEKRRDDSLAVLSLATFGWASFLSHDGRRCAALCPTCGYWNAIWEDEPERVRQLDENLNRIQAFRNRFREFGQALPSLGQALPALLTKLYSDCQTFAEAEIKSLLDRFDQISEAAFQGYTDRTGATPVGPVSPADRVLI